MTKNNCEILIIGKCSCLRWQLNISLQEKEGQNPQMGVFFAKRILRGGIIIEEGGGGWTKADMTPERNAAATVLHSFLRNLATMFSCNCFMVTSDFACETINFQLSKH